MAPAGTTAIICVGLAADTVAFTAPKNIVLFAGVGSKLVPVIVTVDPTGPNNGSIDVIVGAPKLNPGNSVLPFGVVTDTLPLEPLAT